MKKHKRVFSILKTHNENLLWLLYILLASLAGIIGLINNQLQVFEKGDFYFIALSIISPLLVDFIIQNLELKLRNEDHHFLKRKTITIGLSISVIILIIIGLNIKANIIIHIIFQIILYLISVIMSLYMFCLQKLTLYGDEYKELDDKAYDDEIKKETMQLIEKQDNLTKIENEDGKEIKL